MTTARLSNAAGVMRDADVTSTWNAGVVPIASAFDEEQARVGAIAAVDDHERHRLARREHEMEGVVGRQRIGAGLAPSRARSAPASVNCVNETDADACGATVACSVSISWPSMVSVTGTSLQRLRRPCCSGRR